MPKSKIDRPTKQGRRLGGRLTRSRETLDEDGKKLRVKHGGRTTGAFGNPANDPGRTIKSIGNHWLRNA